MPVKFIAIYQDPWVNNTNEFVLILGWYAYTVPSSAVGINVYDSIILFDPEGNPIVQETFTQNNYENTTATAYPYAYSPTFATIFRRIILIPPGWKITNHQKAIGLQGTLEELKGYF
jgi:hypothetical protein